MRGGRLQIAKRSLELPSMFSETFSHARNSSKELAANGINGHNASAEIEKGRRSLRDPLLPLDSGLPLGREWLAPAFEFLKALPSLPENTADGSLEVRMN